ncbi:hypothetical protein ACH5RR_009555 [Cinchona calisaya]|uniref:Uncharacterized protein n=1 Tax=Cinchona calisaya TaxID=153742 RepID=A0ABD3AFB9_9GENT
MAAPPPAPIPPDLDILRGIVKYFWRNRSFPSDVGEHGMIDFVRNYLRSNDADPQQVRQRVDYLQQQYLAARHMLQLGQARLESWPVEDQKKYGIAHFVWDAGRHYSDSIHGGQDVDQTNQASSSRAAGIHHSDSDTPMPTAENTPEKSYSSDRSSNTYFSFDEITPQKSSSSAAHQSNTNTNIVVVSPDSPNQSSSRISKDDASSSTTKRRRLFEDLNQQGGDRDTTATAAQDINILSKMVEYSEANNKVYPYVSAETWSDFVKNWLHSEADPGEASKRIQELRDMYGKYLILNNNNDQGRKPVYSDSPDGRLLLDLSKKLWQHEFGNPDDDSAGGNQSEVRSQIGWFILGDKPTFERSQESKPLSQKCRCASENLPVPVEVRSASASSTDGEEMDKMLFADSPQDGEEATVEEGSFEQVTLV